MVNINNWIEEQKQDFITISDQIWEFAEVKWTEYQSAALLKETLKKNEFSIIDNIAGIPTAFKAVYGTGTPRIAIMGEYDALPGMSQISAPKKQPLKEGDPGHGCGHNLLGVGALAACLVLKEKIKQGEIQGTIVYIGCPAEEGGSAKAFMVKDGAFDDIDIAITWHPEVVNMVAVQKNEATIKIRFNFHGISAHAATDPFHGRSALDAVELMNVGANYLREHIIPGAKLHYIISKGGDAPNIVPAEAESYYYIRAPEVSQILPIFERLKKVAHGAAMMTETSVDIHHISGSSTYHSNKVVSKVLYEAMQEVGPPKFTEEDKKLAEQYDNTNKESFLDKIEGMIPPEMQAMAKVFEGKVLCDVVLPNFGEDMVMPGSSDVGDVSWVVPTSQINTACYSLSTGGHSWQRVAQNKTSIGYKGMLNAAKILALAAQKLYQNLDLITAAKTELKEFLKDHPYTSPLPKEGQPPLPK